MATDSDPPDGASPPAGEQPTAMFNKKMHDYFSSLVDPAEFNAPPSEPTDIAESLAESLGPASGRISIPPAPRAPSLPAIGSGLEIGPEVRESAHQPKLRPAESTRTMTISGPPPPPRIQAPAPLVTGAQEDEEPSRGPIIAIVVIVGLVMALGVMYVGLKFMH